jgi:predicted neuraminidase
MLKYSRRLILLLLLLLTCSLKAEFLTVDKQEFIFKDPPFAACHAATLTETSSGDLLCAWFAGTQEGDSDVAIWLSMFENGQWSPPQKIAQEENVPCWNPVLFTLPSNEILLFYKAGIHPQLWSGFLKRSNDCGHTWSKEEPLPAGIIGPVKNRPLYLKNGTLLCGSSIESWKRWGCWVDITTDGGKSWQKSNPINVEENLFGIIQPALFYGENKEIRLLARSHEIGAICSAESHDQGKTWTAAHPISLPNPNSGIDAINLENGPILLVYNHSTDERFPLNTALSSDGGNSWRQDLILEKNKGEFSYPSVIQTRDGKIHTIYTWNRTQIKHVQMTYHATESILSTPR